MDVRNVNGDAKRSKQCACGTWLNHWENCTGKSLPSSCYVTGCTRTDLVGAHITKVAGDNTQYIVPICKACNNNPDDFKIPDNTSLALASQSKTCG